MLGIGTQMRPSKAWGGSSKLGLLFIELSHLLARGINKFLLCLCCLTRWKAEWVLMRQGVGFGERKGDLDRPCIQGKGWGGVCSGKGEPAVTGWGLHCGPGKGQDPEPRGFALRPDVWFIMANPTIHHHSLYRSNTPEPQILPWGALKHQFQP